MKNAMLIATIGVALAVSPVTLATGAAAASGHHAMMKKKKTAKGMKSEPMQKAGTVGDKAAGGTNGPTDANTGGAGK